MLNCHHFNPSASLSLLLCVLAIVTLLILLLTPARAPFEPVGAREYALAFLIYPFIWAYRKLR
ncbi:hypothetical protein [Spirosoma litoris]